MPAPGAPSRPLPARLPRLPALPQARLLLYPAWQGPGLPLRTWLPTARYRTPQPPKSPELGGRGLLQEDSAQWTLTQHLGLSAHPSRAQAAHPPPLPLQLGTGDVHCLIPFHPWGP